MSIYQLNKEIDEDLYKILNIKLKKKRIYNLNTKSLKFNFEKKKNFESQFS